MQSVPTAWFEIDDPQLDKMENMRELKKRIDELPGQLDSIYKALEKQFQQLIEIYAKQNLFVLSCEGPIKYTDSIANNLFSVEANLLAFNKLLTDDDKQLIIKHSGYSCPDYPLVLASTTHPFLR